MSERRDPQLPPGFDLGQMRKQAKELKAAVRAGDPEAVARVARFHPKYEGRPPERVAPDRMTLRDAQATLAAELGFGGWGQLVAAADEAGSGRAPRWRHDADLALFGRALEQSQAFDHGIVGPEELLLALLRPPHPTAVADALEEVGLTHEAVRTWLLRRSPARPRTDRREYATNPAWSACTGMAKGLALAAGADEVRDELALLALLYQGWLDHHLERVDLTAPELVARLAARGIPVPPLLPPEPKAPHGPMGARVYFPCDEPGVAQGLRDVIRFRAWWGFNRDESGRCYVDGEEDADLPNLVRSLVADPTSIEVVPWEEVVRRGGQS